MTQAEARPDARAAVEEAARMLGGLARRDEPFGMRTTYRAGGRAALFCEVTEVSDLDEVRRVTGVTGLPVIVLGAGSNLLVADAGWRGIVVSLGEPFGGFEIVAPETGDPVTAVAGGALPLPVLARRLASAGLGGLEWAVGVPGSAGGAIKTNAGGHGSDTAATLVSATVVDLVTGEVSERTPGELHLGYRSSALGDREVVTRVVHRVAAADPRACAEVIAGIVRWRREHQPGGQNAGSVFVNPPGDSAGRLVELAGCKGLRAGSAAVSAKHANFIQADPGGSADDVRRLIDIVHERVIGTCGVDLAIELKLVGFADANTAAGAPQGGGP